MERSRKKILREELLVWGYVQDIEKVYKVKNIPTAINGIVYVFKVSIEQEWMNEIRPFLIVEFVDISCSSLSALSPLIDKIDNCIIITYHYDTKKKSLSKRETFRCDAKIWNHQ